MEPYIEFQTTSNFSFLRGASHPHELIERAAELDYAGIGLSDYHTLAGIVRGHVAAKQAKIPYYIGCRADIHSPASLATKNETTYKLSLLIYPQNIQAYGKLCRFLTVGKLRSDKNSCQLTIKDFETYQKDWAIIIAPDYERRGTMTRAELNNDDVNFLYAAGCIKEMLADPGLLSMALTRNLGHRQSEASRGVLEAANHLGIPLLASNNVHFHIAERKPLQDVLTCIREHCNVFEAGYRLMPNAERQLKSPAEMKHLFQDLPAALRRTLEIGDMLTGFSLDQVRYEYPSEILPLHKTPLEHLSDLTWAGAAQRYPSGMPSNVSQLIKTELSLIHELGYEKYFLTCHDIVQFANSRDILCQGRGAAANSAVCYALGITAVDPSRINLLFARFISKERAEPPDIDIDFEHERREEVIQYIYQKYGRDRAGLTCEVITYRQRSAIRDVGKALGLSLEVVDRLAKAIYRWTDCEITPENLREIGLDSKNITIQNALRLSSELYGFPRHLSQHVGGFIISEKPLCELVPILNAGMPDRTIIEWDKDDIETLGMLKIDVLGLGMLTCIRKALEFVNQKRKTLGQESLALYSVPAEDPKVYDMICEADTIGVFQIESRAQMSMLPRLRPRCYYDLVIEVAIVRPGPIQGNMVHPYLKCRAGLTKPFYPDSRVEKILGRTMGVPLFQEQAMQLAIVLANFSPGEAEQLRRAIAAWKRDKGVLAKFKEKVVAGMTANGYAVEFAETCMTQIRGFSEYGFPESHAASFALLVYVSAWLKCHHPAEFAAALINSQPMGFYAPSQIVRDAENHGVSVLPIDVNYSGWDCRVEHSESKPILRLGMRLIRGLAESQALMIEKTVAIQGPCQTLLELWLKCRQTNNRLRKSMLQLLAKADAFQSLTLLSREASWEIRALPEELLPLDGLQKNFESQIPDLPKQLPQQLMFQDYATTGLSLRGHPIGFIRAQLNRRKTMPTSALKTLPKRGSAIYVGVAGIAIVRQRPGTAKGVVFITLEDETGIANLIIRPAVFEKYQRVILSSASMLARGKLERIGQVIYVSAEKLESLDEELNELKAIKLEVVNYSY